MKRLIILLIAVTATFTTFAQTSKEKTPKTKPDTTMQTIFTCGMHPDIVSDTMGRCPICGMGLLEKRIKIETNKSYTCPMHPEVVSDRPGACSKCGMKLVEKKTKERTPAKM